MREVGKDLQSMPSRDLRATRYSADYQQRLDVGLIAFLEHLRSVSPSLSLTKLAARPLHAVPIICVFIQSLYNENPKTKLFMARHALLAIEKSARNLKGKLSECWEVIESWRQEVPGSLRPPMYLPAMLAMAVTGRLLAEASSGHDALLWWSFGVLMEVGFFGLLRPIEILKLTRGHVSLPGELLSNALGFATCMIDNPKNRRQFGRVQFAVIRSANASWWLAWLCAGLTAPEKLWPASAGEFRNRFKRVLEYLQLHNQKFVWASLRAGGATYLFMNGLDPPRIKFYGRWASEKSVGHYLQESVAFQLAHNTSLRSQKLIAAVLKGASDLLTPPAWSLHACYPRQASRRGLARKVNWQTDHCGRSVLRPAAGFAWEELYPKPV